MVNRKRSYAENSAMMAKLKQERLEHQAVARVQSGNGEETLTRNVQRASKKKRRVRKNKKVDGLLWGSNFTAFESTNNKKEKDSLAPEF